MLGSQDSQRLALVFGFLAATVHGCHHDLVRRQRTDTWQSAATINNPAQECAPYSYAPVQAMVRSLIWLFILCLLLPHFVCWAALRSHKLIYALRHYRLRASLLSGKSPIYLVSCAC